jgi:hypothetical protein
LLLLVLHLTLSGIGLVRIIGRVAAAAVAVLR